MQYLLILLLVTQTLGVEITIPPSGHHDESTLLSGGQIIDYQINSTFPVSVYLMTQHQYHQYMRDLGTFYHQGCSRLSVSSTNVSCEYYTDDMSDSVHFVIQNTIDLPTNVTFTLRYTYSLPPSYAAGLIVGVGLGLLILIGIGMGIFIYILVRRPRRESGFTPL